MRKIRVIFIGCIFLIIGVLIASSPPLVRDEISFRCDILILEKSNEVYIPSWEDELMVRNPDAMTEEQKYLVWNEKSDVVRALYKLREASQEQIDKMLDSEQPNIRVYGYLFNLQKRTNIKSEYLLRALDDNATVHFVYQGVDDYGECYASDVMLLAALNGINSLLFTQQANYDAHRCCFGYGFTERQLAVLKEAYEKKLPVNKDIDRFIRRCFDEYKSI